ncbi:hypothetical protein RHA1_ro01665 [Rhodococcus jostii RHA1]|uniref:TM2 domain-containing protein n=1 Tax=Rhodococcus jostii (strain RHA1) TaxID=101510 RepID=Q0SG58_RHOJR|nr:hypothetical protein RHA1_ro01665 [Rhodococcus jostii RHA1]
MYFGAGRFYAGHTGLGFAMLIVNIVLTVISLGMWLFVAWIWPSSTESCFSRANRRTRTDSQ